MATNRYAKDLTVLLGVLAFAGLLGCSGVATPTPIPVPPPAPTATLTPSMSKEMWVCGYDRCRESGLYGKLEFREANVWANPDPNRGRVLRKLKHNDHLFVVNQMVVTDCPGGTWYQLEDGGWMNDFWLTDRLCNLANVPELSFKNCMACEY